MPVCHQGELQDTVGCCNCAGNLQQCWRFNVWGCVSLGPKEVGPKRRGGGGTCRLHWDAALVRGELAALLLL